MNRTPQEIIDRIAQVAAEDWMGTQRGDLIMRLPYEQAKPFLRDGTTQEQFAEEASRLLPPLAQVADYLPFAWDKANDCRGLSAGRSIDHIRAWLWLAGYDIPDAYWDYDCYGKEKLTFASYLCGVDPHEHDTGIWVHDEDGPALDQDELLKRREAANAYAQQIKETK